MPLLTRRRLLLAGTSVVSGLAGCGGADDGATATPTRDGPSTASTTASTPTPDLDLREANVVGVAVAREGGAVSFDVTLHHDDDGEDGYANWWQVERLDGTRLGRRVLAHPHSRQPFTRSDSFEIPAEVSCVVVRGHDQTHGYGGVVGLVALETGTVRLVDQGPSRRSFSSSACPS